MAGENLIQLFLHQVGGAATPAKAAQGGVEDAGVLRHGQVGTERQFLEDTAYAKCAGQSGRPSGLGLPRHHHPPLAGRQHARQHIHQRGLAGAVMADQPDAFATRHAQVHACQGTNCAEIFFDAV